MTFSVHGITVSRGIAIGRAVLVGSSRVDVAHYFIKPDEVEAEIARLRVARDAVIQELQRMQAEMPKDMPPELVAMIDVHLMLLQDDSMSHEVRRWIQERLYNAEWALTSQLEVVVRQIVECCFIQPKERPYQTNNAYTALVRQSQMEKEVNAIVQKAKERNERKSAGQAHPRRKERDSGRHPKV